MVSLSQFEDENVEVTGEIEVGDEDEVITVYTVTRLQDEAEQRLSVFAEDDLGFSVVLPGNWERDESPSGVVMYGIEQQDPSITVSQLTAQTSAALEAREKMTTGNNIQIANGTTPAVRVLHNSGEVDVFITRQPANDILEFSFQPQQKPETEKAVFYDMLGMLEWQDASEVVADEQINDNEVIVCGGKAKKLCPSGYRCELDGLDVNATGICVSSSLSPDVITKILSEQSAPEIPEDAVLRSDSDDEELMIPNEYTVYNRERFNYTFAIPKSWWWSENGESEAVISKVSIAPEEVTPDNTIVTLEIHPNSIDSRQAGEYGNAYEIKIPRDDESHFIVRGDAEFETQIKNIADSLSFLSST